ncbi:3-methyl-2-oxobutanoate hydroxymethyltransferase, partial [candidate division KSB1 bacterium]|nr:3-methyl-2-oxobutanoate hydroxymethyltransferase [candidate division KSB1 bacterium]
PNRPLTFFAVQHAECSWDSFWCTVQAGINQGAADNGVEVTILAPDEFDLDKTASLIEQAVAAQPDGIMLTVTDPVLFSDPINAALDAGIPVMGHLGLTPQTATKLGGYKVQGKTEKSAKRMLEDAVSLEQAGCFALVLEAVPSKLAESITAEINIPTIGIGAGPACDGQVLVFHDILGLFDQFTPRFVKQYANLREPILNAIRTYRQEVESGVFPTDSHSF